MTRAVCLACGTMKIGALTNCFACGVGPPNVDTALLLSDHFFDHATLEALGPVVAQCQELATDPSVGLAAFLTWLSRCPGAAFEPPELTDAGVGLVDEILVQLRPPSVELVSSGALARLPDVHARVLEQPVSAPRGVAVALAVAVVLGPFALLLLTGHC